MWAEKTKKKKTWTLNIQNHFVVEVPSEPGQKCIAMKNTVSLA